VERNLADPDFHHEFNELCQIKSDVRAMDKFCTISLLDLTMEKFLALVAMCNADNLDTTPYLLRLVAPYGIVDRFPDCYEACKQISPFALVARERGVLRVAVHVRRGELLILDQDRMLPNAYYISVAQNVARVLEALRVDYQIELHTEVAEKEFTVQPDDHGMFNRLSSPVIVSPQMNRLEEFSALPHLVRCINERTIDCLRKLATADILIMSKSSFSYVAGILNRNGVILYHPFWHPAPAFWMAIEPDGRFDELKFREAVGALSQSHLRHANPYDAITKDQGLLGNALPEGEGPRKFQSADPFIPNLARAP
jgi:hypothetical protein